MGQSRQRFFTVRFGEVRWDVEGACHFLNRLSTMVDVLVLHIIT